MELPFNAGKTVFVCICLYANCLLGVDIRFFDNFVFNFEKFIKNK